jgi:hypothetical protein
MSDIPGAVKNGSPWDQVNHDVYDVRARVAHWLINRNNPPGSLGRLQMVQDPEATQLLAQAEEAGAVPADVADAYRALIEARTLADGPPDGVSAEDAARLRERYGVLMEWLETQG